MKSRFLCLVFLCLLSSAAEAKIKFPNTSSTDCVFYPQLEAILKCEKVPPNYLSGYGAKYCNEFQSRKKDWADSLKAWTGKTTLCLQKTLTYDEELLNPCSKIQDYAFDSHPRCYKSSGFCDLTREDKSRIVEVVNIADINSTLGSSLLQGLSIKLKCDIGVSSGTVIILSFIWKIVKGQVVEWKNQAVALVEFIFEDLKNIDLRAKMVFAEIVGFPVQSSTSPNAYAELSAFDSMEPIGEGCLHGSSKTERLCAGMTARYGADWYSVSAEKQFGFAREGLKRAYLKYGRGRNQ